MKINALRIKLENKNPESALIFMFEGTLVKSNTNDFSEAIFKVSKEQIDTMIELLKKIEQPEKIPLELVE